MFQSFKSVIDNFKKEHGTSMNCMVCEFYNDLLLPERTIKASAFEQNVYGILDRLYSAGDWIYGARPLLGNVSSADAWFPALRLFIMIDGETHFEDAHGKPYTQQEDRDDDFNYEAIDKDFSVLRLHYEDVSSGSIAGLIKSVVTDCQRSKRRPFLDFSPAFKRPREVP